MKITKIIWIMLFSLVVFHLVTSCNKNSELDMVDKQSLIKNYIAKENLYSDSFLRLIGPTNMTIEDIIIEMDNISRQTSEIADTNQVFYLYDQLLELAIGQDTSKINDCRIKYNWYYKLWYVSMRAFLGGMKQHKTNYEYWDKIFKFYEKYSNEIINLEKSIDSENNNSAQDCNVKKKKYVRLMRGELKAYINVMRNGYFHQLSQNYTAEQKDDILRRFKEVEKHTITPPHYPGGRAQGVY
jgi:hypothetical protein